MKQFSHFLSLKEVTLKIIGMCNAHSEKHQKVTIKYSSLLYREKDNCF